MKKEKEEEIFLEELLGKSFEKEEKPYDEEKLFGEEEFEQSKENFEQSENSVFEKALLDFAKAFGKEPEEVSRILKKGEEFDELFEKFGKAKGDSEVFEKLAEIRGISKEEMKEEILWALEKATFEKAVLEILEANPGMNRETAKELANFRLEVKKAKQQKPEEDANEKMLFELEKFLAAHSGEGIEKLSGGIVEDWEGGIPLETAFEKHRLFKENERLLEEIEKMKNEKEKEAHKNYAREHSPGSATSAAGTVGIDEFVEGLFKEY